MALKPTVSSTSSENSNTSSLWLITETQSLLKCTAHAHQVRISLSLKPRICVMCLERHVPFMRLSTLRMGLKLLRQEKSLTNVERLLLVSIIIDMMLQGV